MAEKWWLIPNWNPDYHQRWFSPVHSYYGEIAIGPFDKESNLMQWAESHPAYHGNIALGIGQLNEKLLADGIDPRNILLYTPDEVHIHYLANVSPFEYVKSLPDGIKKDLLSSLL